MAFSDTEMKELGKSTQINIHNTRSLIRALKYVSDILQTEEVFTAEEYKYTHTSAAKTSSKSVWNIRSIYDAIHFDDILPT